MKVPGGRRDKMVVSTSGGTPSYHPFIDGIFHERNHPATGIPPLSGNPQIFTLPRDFPIINHDISMDSTKKILENPPQIFP